MQSGVQRNWTDATAFYAERDHRTQLEVNGLHRYVSMPVEIWVDRSLANDITIQRITLVAANLTARWSRNVRVVVPDVALAEPLQIHGDKTLASRIKREMLEADPFGNFTITHTLEFDPASIRLYVGSCKSQAFMVTANDYLVDAAGWTALGRRGTIEDTYQRSSSTAPVAALAGAIGAADLFKRAIGQGVEHWLGDVNWCMWHNVMESAVSRCGAPAYGSSVAELGELLVAGVGAVGSAFLFILSLMPIRGRITAFDRDFVDASNLNRSPLFTATDAAVSRAKSEVALDLLRRCGIEGKAVQGTWTAFGELLGRKNFDLWVSLTNEDGAWADVPFQLPPVVLHGTTTSGWGIGFGRHVPRVEDCTLCRLPRPRAEFRGPCAEGDIAPPENSQPIRASLPFLSTVSASLIAAEVLKLEFPEIISLPNAVYADFRYGLPIVLSSLLGPTSGCPGCQITNSSLWIHRRGLSRHVSLSNAKHTSREQNVTFPDRSENVGSDLRIHGD
ncbi:MAG: ThiF family adenylyltransferase [Acidobacteriia bacterium]|nr:ThiF family adenylyltransferase [Terriglobia bacterium]